MKKVLFYTIVLLLLIYNNISAEVMDKEASVEFMWGWCLISVILAYFLYKLHVYWAFIVLPVSLLFPISLLAEIRDNIMGQAILQEAGAKYFIHAYLSSLVLVICHIFLLVIFRIKQIRRVKQ
jgi:hypothetical protein